MERSSRRHEGPAHLVHVALERHSTMPISRQLYLQLRQAIVSGQIPAAARLPSTRAATKLWSVSRGSVVEAYETLLNEGYASGRAGSGTYVAKDVPERSVTAVHAQTQRAAVSPRLSRAALASIQSAVLEPPPQVPFVTGRSAPDAKTRSILKRLAYRHVGILSDHYRDPQGELLLRETVSSYLAAARGLRCSPERIFITAGSQQAIDLAIRTLTNPGDQVAMEDPGYPPARLALAAHGTQQVAVPVDGDGIRVDSLAEHGDAIQAVYVTPSNQYPTGAVLSMARRLALVDWAAANGSWILEDDYDSEFRYDERPLAALQGIDDHQTVIYIGTFSKALLPGLRLGYLVVPDRVVPAFRRMRILLDRFPAPFQQLVVADFLREGHFSSHLRRLREAYRTSRNSLVSALGDRKATPFTVNTPHQGVHMIAHLPEGTDDVAFAGAARRAGVTVLPISPMCIGKSPRQGLLLGFSALTDAEIDVGVARLGHALDGLKRKGSR
ncbi:PLP-dependent aminotransferase family protein [Mesorhizobium amorphae]|uniref:MocR-like pyridoxine biosynthesis transcription factor PdxR n=1 Tax=Mesorhizobium amorphae TaxID=71433 RepID=UPI00118501CC|nr:PLP-dependent aminotransferase family protein [Mesorhizobium amorphae]